MIIQPFQRLRKTVETVWIRRSSLNHLAKARC